jgi:hypothetical protein
MGKRERTGWTLLVGAAMSLAGCMWGPTNGSVYDGDGGTTSQQIVAFSGFYSQPNHKVRVQVLKTPELDPAVEKNWTDVPGSPATTGTQPYNYNDPNTPMYLWQLDAKPGAVDGGWPSGGIARVRAQAITPNGTSTPVVDNTAVVFDDDFVACRGEHSSESWEDIMTACETRYGSHQVANLVSSRTRTARRPSTATSSRRRGTTPATAPTRSTTAWSRNTAAPATWR